MASKRNFERLIKAAWDVIERDFDETAFLAWRKRAFDYLHELMGPDHYYTKYFGDKVSQVDAMGLLSGTGVLSAARESMINSNRKLLSTVGV